MYAFGQLKELALSRIRSQYLATSLESIKHPMGSFYVTFHMLCSIRLSKRERERVGGKYETKSLKDFILTIEEAKKAQADK